LNEYTQHLALINYLSVSGEKSLLEHINSFHQVITNPVQIKDGYFVTPLEAGYSVEYKVEAIAEYEYPNGQFWTGPKGLGIRNGEKR
jgi:L-galactonate dehydratase